jgi:hypothetical protein
MGGQALGPEKLDLMDSIAARAFVDERAQRYMCAGLCFVIWMMVSWPSPVLPGNTVSCCLQA